MISLLLVLLTLPLTPLQGRAPAEELASWRAAAAYSEARGGLSLLVQRGGEVVFEQYADGHGPDKPFFTGSASVGLWAVAALCATQDGLLALDEPVSATISEWRGVAGKESITVRQLLLLESGLAANDRKVRDSATIDHYQAALEAQMVSLPGQVFRFGPTSWFVLQALLERKLASKGEDALAYLRRRVLEPIGMELFYWDRDRSARPSFNSGAYLTARDWSRFGQLLLDRGRAGGRQVVAAELLALCWQPSALELTYGLGFWLVGALDGAQTAEAGPADEGLQRGGRVEDRAAALPQDLCFSAGLGKQRLFVLPSAGLVVVRQGFPADGWSDVDFLRLLLGLDPPSSGR